MNASITKTKILVVDDEDCIRNLVQATLNRDGRHILLAVGGKDAITAFRRERPAITILDLDMPDVDGLTVLKQIRQIRPDATVFIFTGTDNPEAEREARKLGVTEFLYKGLALPTAAEIEARAKGSPKPSPAPPADSSWWKLKL